MKKILIAATLMMGLSQVAMAANQGPTDTGSEGYVSGAPYTSYAPTAANCPTNTGSERPNLPCGPGVTYYNIPSKLGVSWTNPADAQCYYPYTLASQGQYTAAGFRTVYFCQDPTVYAGGNGSN